MEKPSAKGYAVLGEAHCNARNFEKAEEAWRMGLESDPRSEVVYRGMALCFGWTGQLRKSLNAYKKILEINPEATFTYHEMARLHYELNEPDRAKELWNKAMDVFPLKADV